MFVEATGESGGGRRAASRLGAEAAAGRIRRAGVNSEGRPRNWGHACGSARPGNGSCIQSRGCAPETRPFVRLIGSGDTVGSSGDGKSECGDRPDREGRVCPRAALRPGRVNRSFFNRQTLALHSGLTPYAHAGARHPARRSVQTEKAGTALAPERGYPSSRSPHGSRTAPTVIAATIPTGE